MRSLERLSEALEKLRLKKARHHFLYFEDWRNMTEAEFIEKFRQDNKTSPYDTYFVVYVVESKKDVKDLNKMFPNK